MQLFEITNLQLTSDYTLILTDNQNKVVEVSLMELLQKHPVHHTKIIALLSQQQDSKLVFLREMLLAYQASPSVFQFHAGSGDIVWGDKIINNHYFQTIAPTPLPKHLNHFSLYKPSEVIGREEDLKAVRAALIAKQHVVIVNGWGGVGKSTLAADYMEQYNAEYQHIFGHRGMGDVYITEENDKLPKNTLAKALLEDRALHKNLKIREEIVPLLASNNSEQALNLLYTALKALPEPILWVVDNASVNDLVEIDQLRSKFPHFHILITSRCVATDLPIHELNCLAEKDAVALLYYYYDLGNAAPLSEAEKQTYWTDAATIANLAGYHTLTLELIGGLLKNKRRFTFPSLRETLANKVIAYLETSVKVFTPYKQDQRDHINKDYISNIIEQVFDLAELASDEKAQWLLRHFAILPSTNIDADMMEELLNVNKVNVNDYDEGLDTLLETGWVKERHSPTLVYDCHSIIQEVVRKRLSPTTQNCEMLWVKVQDIADNQDKIPPKELKTWIPYLESVVEKLPLANETGVGLLLKIGNVYVRIANYALALRFQQRAISICKHLWGENHVLLANSYNNIAHTYKELGNYQQSLSFNLKAIEIREKVLDKYHPYLATSYHNIATTYKKLGDYQQALAFDLKAIEIKEKVLDKYHPDLATSYNNIAATYQYLGDYQQALAFDLKAIEISEKVLDKYHPYLATSYNNIAVVYEKLGNYAQALTFDLKVIEIREKVLDVSHPDLAQSYNNIAITYEKLGDYQQALAFALKDIEICEKVLDKYHPDLATSYNNIAIIYYHFQNWALAVQYEKQAIEILLKALPSGHPYIKEAVNTMAGVLGAAIKAEGREKYEEVIQWFLRECREYLEG